MSTAILSFAARVTVQPYLANGALDPAGPQIIQAANCTVEGSTNLQDFTNFESNGFAEFAPTYVITNIQISDGVLDSSGPAGTFATGIYNPLQSKLQVLVIFYFLKLNANNPQKITATKCIVEKASIKADVHGGVDKVSASLRVIGKVTFDGVDVQAISGIVV